MDERKLFKRIEDGVKRITRERIMAQIDVVDDAREFRMCMPDTLTGSDVRALREITNVADVLLLCREDYLCLRVCTKVDEEHRKLAAQRRAERVALLAGMQVHKRENFPDTVNTLVASMIQHLPCDEPVVDAKVPGLFTVRAIIRPNVYVSWEELRAFASAHEYNYTLGLESDDTKWWMVVEVSVPLHKQAVASRKRAYDRITR